MQFHSSAEALYRTDVGETIYRPPGFGYFRKPEVWRRTGYASQTSVVYGLTA